LYQCNAQAGEGAVLGGVGGVEEVGEEETDDLERHGDHGVPNKGEYGADGEPIDVDFVRDHAGGEDCGFPVGRGRVSSGLFVGGRLLI